MSHLGSIKMKPFNNVNRIVIAELEEHPGYAEVLLVSDGEGDYAPLLFGFSSMAERFTLDDAAQTVQRHFNRYPYSFVKISHIKSKMSKEDADAIIMKVPA